MKKIDFQNVLKKEIISLSSNIQAIENEITERKNVRVYSRSSDNMYSSWTPVDLAVNERVISELETTLKGKKEWLEKLQDKIEVDTEELKKDYDLMLSDPVLEKGLTISDPHDKARFNYAATEFSIWMEKKDDSAHMEATVFWHRCMKEILELSN